MKNNDFNSEKIRVCGVNSDACVRETVQTLAEKLPDSKITVALEACGDDYVITKERLKKSFTNKNVSLVGRYTKKGRDVA